MRCVVDTSVLISAVAFSPSIPREALGRVLRRDVLLFSEATTNELKEVLFRRRFDRYVSRKERALFLSQLESVSEIVPVIQQVRACRDPKDDMFLEVALNGRADIIITGDRDLLVLHPWRNVEILTPKKYLLCE